MTNEALDTTNKLVKPEDISISDDAVIQQLSDNLQGITPEEVDAMYTEMDKAEKIRNEQETKREIEEKRLKKIESMKWNKEMIFENLRNNYLKFENGVKYMWYRWKKMSLELPAIWNFEWFKFNCFISNRRHHYRSKMTKMSYSIEEIWKLLDSLNKYLKELWVETDGDIDYEKDLQNSLKKDEYKTYNVLECLKKITWLSNFYWVANKSSRWALNSVKMLDYYKNDCCLYWKTLDNDWACFLLKLSE